MRINYDEALYYEISSKSNNGNLIVNVKYVAIWKASMWKKVGQPERAILFEIIRKS